MVLSIPYRRFLGYTVFSPSTAFRLSIFGDSLLLDGIHLPVPFWVLLPREPLLFRPGASFCLSHVAGILMLFLPAFTGILICLL